MKKIMTELLAKWAQSQIDRRKLRCALHILGVAIFIDPDNPNLYTSRGMVRHEVNDLNGTVKDYSRAHKLDPTNWETEQSFMAFRIEQLRRINELTGPIVKKMSEPDPYMAANAYRRAEYWEKKNDLPKAIESYTSALRYAPEHNGIQYSRAAALEKAGIPLDALRDLSEILARDENFIPARQLRGVVRYELNDIDGALDDFELVRGVDPTEMTTVYNIGLIWHKKGIYSKAIECFDEVIDREPLHQAALLARGFSKVALGKSHARRDFDSVLELDPNCAEAYYGLGLYWEKTDLKEARAQLRKAMELGSHEAIGELENLDKGSEKKQISTVESQAREIKSVGRPISPERTDSEYAHEYLKLALRFKKEWLSQTLLARETNISQSSWSRALGRPSFWAALLNTMEEKYKELDATRDVLGKIYSQVQAKSKEEPEPPEEDISESVPSSNSEESIGGGIDRERIMKMGKRELIAAIMEQPHKKEVTKEMLEREDTQALRTVLLTILDLKDPLDE